MEPKIGSAVTFVDSKGRSLPAVVTHVHGVVTETSKPAINLIHVSADETKTDPYGRQAERVTSVVHQGQQSAGGMYYTL